MLARATALSKFLYREVRLILAQAIGCRDTDDPPLHELQHHIAHFLENHMVQHWYELFTNYLRLGPRADEQFERSRYDVIFQAIEGLMNLSRYTNAENTNGFTRDRVQVIKDVVVVRLHDFGWQLQESLDWELCTICLGRTHLLSLHELACGHHHCTECLIRNITQSSKSIATYPPRCCPHIAIPWDSYGFDDTVLPADIKKRLRELSIEYRTKNRTYCHEPRCSAFILPNRISDNVGICPECARHTCTQCKAAAHAGPCPRDHRLEQVLQIAGEERWKRCKVCGHIIERTEGCNIISEFLHLLNFQK